jgi:hypothetical protein
MNCQFVDFDEPSIPVSVTFLHIYENGRLVKTERYRDRDEASVYKQLWFNMGFEVALTHEYVY